MEMNVLRFLRWMHARGWPTYLYAHPDTPLYQHALDTAVETRPLVTNSRYGSLQAAWKTARLIDEDQLRAIILHQARDLLLGVAIRSFSRSRPKVIYHQHMHIGGDKRDFYHAWLYRRLHALVTTGPTLVQQVLAKTVVPRDQIHIIPRGIELDRYLHNRPEQNASRKLLNLPLDVPLLGLIGRLDPQKGQLTAVRALSRVRESGYPLHLVLVGAETKDEQSGYIGEIRQEIATHDLKDCVHFRPYQPKTEKAFAALDYFVMASRSETYGMVTIEALASRLPVIGTASGGTFDLIEPEQNGLLYPPEDDLALSRCLIRLLEDPALAARLAARAESDAKNKYAHEQQCIGWEHLLHSLSQQRR